MELSLEQVQARIDGLPLETQKSVVCALVGHSKIQTTFWGEWCCSRCGEKVGDSWAGAYTGKGIVVVGHNCQECHDTYEKMTWRDTFMAPDPFAART